MQPARIAELLAPFLSASPHGCHSEHAPSASESLPRVAELCEGVEREPAALPIETLQSISTYIDLLLRWNARINLTAIRDPEEIVTRHFGESLFAASHLFASDAHGAADASSAWPSSNSTSTDFAADSHHEREGHGFSRAASAPENERALAPEENTTPTTARKNAGAANLATSWKSGALAPRGEPKIKEASAPANAPRLADLGSGAGFPGIPIKLFAPQIHLTLIESNHKKSTFLREVARTLTLTDVDILTTRAESLDTSLHHSFDVVTLRAVERFDQVLPASATLLAGNSRLALLIGSSQIDQAHQSLPKLSWSDPLPIPQSQSRILLIGCNSSLPEPT